MKATRFAAAFLIPVLLSAPLCLGAGLERYKDWNKSPEFLLLATEAEQKEWKKIATDEDAERFVQLFWAKRDPDLKTAINEYEVAFDQRVRDADQGFAMPRLRGALTERGKAYVLIGVPKSVQRTPGTKKQPAATATGEIAAPNEPGTSIGQSIFTFVYEAAQLPDWTKTKALTVDFVVEQSSDYATGKSAGILKRLEGAARTALVKNPDLKVPPHFRTAAELEADR